MHPYHRLTWIAATFLAILIGFLSELPEPPKPALTGDYEVDLSYDHGPQALNLAMVKELIPYLSSAREAGIEGEVRLRIKVDAKGNYAGHEVLDSFHPLLRIPCEAYIKQLKFRPASQNGRPILGTFIFRHAFSNTIIDGNHRP